jgi:hypothetical protein
VKANDSLRLVELCQHKQGADDFVRSEIQKLGNKAIPAQRQVYEPVGKAIFGGSLMKTDQAMPGASCPLAFTYEASRTSNRTNTRNPIPKISFRKFPLFHEAAAFFIPAHY